MALYQRTGTPYWWYSFRIDGKLYRGSTETTNRREAMAVKKQRRDEAFVALRTSPNRPASNEMSLKHAVDKYFEEEGHELSEGKFIRKYLDSIVEFLGGHKPLSSISDRDIERLVAHRSKEHVAGDPKRPLVKPATVNRSTVQALQPVFARARKIWKVSLPAEPNWSVHKLEEPKERVRVLKTSENEKFEAAFDPDYEALRQFGLQSALRKRAMLLRWSNVDFEEKLIEVKTKRGKIARIPITPTIKSILIGRRGHHPEWVFTFVAKRTASRVINGKTQTFEEGKRYPITYWGWTTYFKRRAKEAGVKNFHIHDMRHDRATRVYQATGDLAVVQKLLGHSNISTTQKYAHVSTDHIMEAMLKADRVAKVK